MIRKLLRCAAEPSLLTGGWAAWPILALLGVLGAGPAESQTATPSRTAFGGPTQKGTAFVLSCAGELPQGSLVGDCLSFPRPNPGEYTVDMEADGVPRIFVVYAVMPEGDPVQLAGATFGIEYSDSIQLTGWGYCHGNGVVIPTPEYPESGAGLAISFNPTYEESPAPIAWFVMAATEDGYFEVQPSPLPSQAARVGNFDPKPHLEPVVGFGRIGFGDEKGTVPEVGLDVNLGLCCLDRCLSLTEFECAYYGGLFLGPGVCDPAICESETPGACCVLGDCEVLTRADCFTRGGKFLGEGSTCSEDVCADEEASK